MQQTNLLINVLENDAYSEEFLMKKAPRLDRKMID